MRVLLVNGSPHEKGSTYTALKEVEKELIANGIETEIFFIGKDPISGCSGCGHCFRSKANKCVIDDCVNIALEKASHADGLIFGSAVHFSGITGGLKAFLDRFFYACYVNEDNPYRYKPAAALVCSRRGGAVPAFDQLNKYFTISSMPVVSSQYWNMVYGNRPEEVKQDLEGMQTMRKLARNMVWLLRCIELGGILGINPGKNEEKPEITNFIR